MTSSLVVHLVYAKLSDLDLGRTREELLPKLPPPDQLRYASLRRPQRREQFLAGRLLAMEGQTRGLLDPSSQESPAPSFNIAHSGPFVACAFAPLGRLGCDIERMTPRAVEAYAEIICSPLERMELVNHRASDPQARFYRYWTVKEALSKACRQGLALDWRTLEVSLDSRALFYPSGLLPESRVSVISALLDPDLAIALALLHEGTTEVTWRCWERGASAAWGEAIVRAAKTLRGQRRPSPSDPQD